MCAVGVEVLPEAFSVEEGIVALKQAVAESVGSVGAYPRVKNRYCYSGAGACRPSGFHIDEMKVPLQRVFFIVRGAESMHPVVGLGIEHARRGGESHHGLDGGDSLGQLDEGQAGHDVVVLRGEFDRLLDAWFGNLARVLLPGRGFYIWGGYANVANYPPALKASKLYFSQTIIWDKQHPVLTRKDFMGAHEWCFYGWKEGAAHQFFGPANVPDLWPVKKVNPQSMVHLTEKPVELAARALAYSSKAGENVLDLFGGSGSTLMACEQAGRHAYLMEIDPAYCDVIVGRWEAFTGKKAERTPAP